MLLFGHSFIKSENIYHISDIDSILKTPPNATLYLEFSIDNLDIISYLVKNSIRYVLKIHNIEELIYANALEATFALVDSKLAKTAQQTAESYIFDTKILVYSEDEKEIEKYALLSLDGILFPSAIIKV